MAYGKKIKVLIVDDSMFFREVLAKELSKDEGLEIVATAADAYAARDMILKTTPDVLTLDVEMPKMNGIEFLKRLIPQYPVPVVVVSSVSENVFDALKAGAVDFVTKPQAGKPETMNRFVKELMVKIKIASMAKIRESRSGETRIPEVRPGETRTTESRPGETKTAAKPVEAKIANKAEAVRKTCRFVAIGASTGGTEAILEVVRDLPETFPGIVVVQHMPAGFTKLYAQRLDQTCKMRVKEAEDGDLILPGRIIIAAGEFHMKVKRRGDQYYIESRQGDRVNGHCPSVDVLFDSISALNEPRCTGIILTGMGADGAKGLLAMKEHGAFTIGQDEESCVVYGMPKVAWQIGAVQQQSPLSKIKDILIQSVR